MEYTFLVSCDHERYIVGIKSIMRIFWGFYNFHHNVQNYDFQAQIDTENPDKIIDEINIRLRIKTIHYKKNIP